MNLYTRFLRSRTKIGRPVFVRPEVELLEARNLLSAPPTNVLVNNPAEDTIPMQDTQSETAIVLGSKSNAVVAYNDTGLYSYPTPLNPNLLGYSLSTNGGTSFTDEGQPQPNPPYWQGTDPALARSSKTGTIFLSSTTAGTRFLEGWANASWSPVRWTTARPLPHPSTGLWGLCARTSRGVFVRTLWLLHRQHVGVYQPVLRLARSAGRIDLKLFDAQTERP